jgi:acetyl-CoA carboxylase, biotin carboxylase subunit
MSIRTLFVANRGEIAVRIVRAAKAMGLRTVQAASAVDKDMLAAQMADAVAEIGPAQAAKSYLNKEAVVAAAVANGADALHPGYGFLSENAEFAAMVEGAGLVFVGPRPETIRAMGDKAAARQMAARAGVPTVRGSEGRIDSAAAARRAADEIGYPVIIKAAAGGGGRGIRIAETAAEIEAQIPLAGAEALAAFGDGGLYLESFVPRARHVEVQILGDGRNAIHLFERECSLQRRRQKVWEEAPAVCLSGERRQALCDSAARLAESVGYRGAGTMEYLYDETSGEFYFIEMNTRIQVEHPVTEMITGVDLVQSMLRIAGGERLPCRQSDVAIRSHAIEVRINAENPARAFMPAPGRITNLSIPEGEGVRFDTMLYEGYVVPPFYDSLLGKLIVSGKSREEALERLGVALRGLSIGGLATTRELHLALLEDKDIQDGAVHTRWLEEWLPLKLPTIGSAA